MKVFLSIYGSDREFKAFNSIYTKLGTIVASNAFVYTNAKTPHFCESGNEGFLLVEALPQAPVNAVFQTAAARFWESLFLLSTLSKIVFPCFVGVTMMCDR